MSGFLVSQQKIRLLQVYWQVRGTGALANDERACLGRDSWHRQGKALRGEWKHFSEALPLCIHHPQCERVLTSYHQSRNLVVFRG